MGTQRDAVRWLFDEFKTSAQFAPTWDRAVENVELIRRKEMAGTLPNQDDIGHVSATISRGGSPAYWMQQVDVPAWFIRDELGVGSSVNVFDTARNLKTTNARRARTYADTLKRLEEARKVLSRKVTG